MLGPFLRFPSGNVAQVFSSAMCHPSIDPAWGDAACAHASIWSPDGSLPLAITAGVIYCRLLTTLQCASQQTWANAGRMLGQRRRRWTNILPASVPRFALLTSEVSQGICNAFLIISESYATGILHTFLCKLSNLFLAAGHIYTLPVNMRRWSNVFLNVGTALQATGWH